MKAGFVDGQVARGVDLLQHGQTLLPLPLEDDLDAASVSVAAGQVERVVPLKVGLRHGIRSLGE